jgi:ABC-2 type transport system permease protein
MTRMLAFAQRDLRLTLSYPFALVMPFISIAVTVAGFAFLSRLINPHAPLDAGAGHLNYFTYVVLNLAFMLLLNQALQAASNAVRRDQLAGTLEPIVSTTTSLPLMILGSSLWPMSFAAVQAGAYIAFAQVFGLHFGHVEVLGFALTLLAAMTCMAAIGVFAAAAVLRFRQTPPSSFLVGSAAALLTGVLFPVHLLPPPLQIVSWLLPLTHALHGIRASLAGAPFAAVSSDILWLSVASALLIPIALVAFRAALTQVRIDGTLASY